MACLIIVSDQPISGGSQCLWPSRSTMSLGSHFWLTPKVGGKVDPHRLTQVARALRELGIQMIPAYSPQARGRSERLVPNLVAVEIFIPIIRMRHNRQVILS